MTAWPKPRVEAFRREFYNYLQFVRINSKDRGQITLGDNLFESQIRYADAIFDSLSNGIHDIKHLKSRQLGISTFSWAFDLFWLGMFDGLEGVLILDTAFNLEKARMSLNMMIDNLPKSLGFPSRDKSDGGSSNRSFIKLSNNSVLSLLSAGIRETKTGGGLGRSLGVNFVHASELCNWANTEGLESFRNSLSTEYENRLYLWESTGRGYNDWWKMWNAARKDPHHQRCHFTGWWGKDSQRIQRGHPDFLRYADAKISDEEKEKIAEVERMYGWHVTLEQLAWFRRHVDPSAKETGEEKIYEATSLQLIEQPWTEEDCFAQNSDNFFDPKDLTDNTNKHGSTKFKAYYYYAGMSFDALKITKAANIKSQALKVWEEPEEEGVYVVAVDPAYGISERNDRSCVQVYRCYSDALEQVAEYVSPLINTKQLAWVVAHLLGWYDNCYLIQELNGPGDSVWRELKDLKKDVKNNTMYGVPLEEGIFNVFGNVRNFIYTRSDSIYAGKARQMKTTGPLKVTFMERMRDYTMNGMLMVRSLDCLEEMRTMQRDGDSISASGANHDDRVLATALAVLFWDETVRQKMTQLRRTREREQAKRKLSLRDMTSMYVDHQMGEFFAKKRKEQIKAQQLATKQKWRGR